MTTTNELEIGEYSTDDVKELIKKATNNRSIFPNFDKIFTNVDNFFILDERSHERISLILSKFLLSSFSLEYLKLLNMLIETKYRTPQLTLWDFEDSDKLIEKKEYFLKIRDEPFINWLIEDCLNELNDIIDDTSVTNSNDLNKLGHIIKLTMNEFESENDIQDIELYDLLYRFKDRLEIFDLNQSKNYINLKYKKTEKTTDGGHTEITFEAKFNDESTHVIREVIKEFDL